MAPSHSSKHARQGGHKPADFEAWARALDDPARDAWQKPAEVVAALGLVEGMAVADIGAGTGYFERSLSEAVGPSGKVIACEIDAELVSRIRRRFRDREPANFEARLVSASDAGLADQSVDRILIVDTWHHMEERGAYAAKLRAALRPGGAIVIVDRLPELEEGPPRELRLSPEMVIAELEGAGFRAERTGPELPKQFIVWGRVGP